jgi:hypothetical protein
MIAVTRLRNVLVGVALVLLGGATLVAASSFAWGNSAANDAALFPRTIAVLLVVVGVIIATTGALRSPGGAFVASEEGEGIPFDVDLPEELLADREPEGVDTRAGLLTAALIVAYCFSAFSLGFVTSTFLFLATGGLVLGHGRQWKRLVTLGLFAVAFTAAYYVGFFVLLDVREPHTLLP